jgi:CubicO group peptidase (beta-lactamase class C family)
MNDMQQQVQEAIDQLVESGAERGLQVAVYRQGEQVVDAVTGVADPATGRPVGSDTVFYTYSVGKAMASTLVHMLVERGMSGYDTTIAKLWPEFGAHGKETVTVRHVLTHRRKAKSLYAEAAWLPNSGRALGSSPLGREGENAFLCRVMAITRLLSL